MEVIDELINNIFNGCVFLGVGMSCFSYNVFNVNN